MNKISLDLDIHHLFPSHQPPLSAFLSFFPLSEEGTEECRYLEQAVAVTTAARCGIVGKRNNFFCSVSVSQLEAATSHLIYDQHKTVRKVVPRDEARFQLPSREQKRENILKCKCHYFKNIY